VFRIIPEQCKDKTKSQAGEGDSSQNSAKNISVVDISAEHGTSSPYNTEKK
jgi:hypothetical protein